MDQAGGYGTGAMPRQCSRPNPTQSITRFKTNNGGWTSQGEESDNQPMDGIEGKDAGGC